MDARLGTALVGLGVSVAVSVLAWVYLDSVFLFFLVPFVPFLFRDREQTVRECPVCDFRTTDDDHEYCPRDGHRLDERERRT